MAEVNGDAKEIDHIDHDIAIVKKLPDISEEKREELIKELLFDKQVVQFSNRESARKIPQLEDEDYKIDKNMSHKEKLEPKNWREEEEVMINMGWVEKKMILLKKDVWNKWYVREYPDDWSIPKEFRGVQKFNRNAIKSLWLINRLPRNYKEFANIIRRNTEEKSKVYESYDPLKDDNFNLSGRINPLSGHRLDQTKIQDVNIWGYYRLWNGNSAEINTDKEQHNFSSSTFSPSFGCSLRLKKVA